MKGETCLTRKRLPADCVKNRSRFLTMTLRAKIILWMNSNFVSLHLSDGLYARPNNMHFDSQDKEKKTSHEKYFLLAR